MLITDKEGSDVSLGTLILSPKYKAFLRYQAQMEVLEGT